MAISYPKRTHKPERTLQYESGDILSTKLDLGQTGKKTNNTISEGKRFQWEIGDSIKGMYSVIGVLGEGGMGKVIKVHHKHWNKTIAVKVPKEKLFYNNIEKVNFIRETETWVNLGLHPNVVSCYYVRTLNDLPVVFIEYVNDGSLYDWIRTKKLYTGKEYEILIKVLDISIQMAEGLHYAHQKGLIHQDVKPANVMINNDFIIKVTDFGLSKSLSTLRLKTGASSIENGVVSCSGMTPVYCSPEQFAGRNLTIHTDIWSWGLSVFEMFNGGVSWEAGQIANKVLEAYLVNGPIISIPLKMPSTIRELLRKCFSLKASDRPQDMQNIVDVLKQYRVELNKNLKEKIEPYINISDSFYYHCINNEMAFGTSARKSLPNFHDISKKAYEGFQQLFVTENPVLAAKQQKRHWMWNEKTEGSTITKANASISGQFASWFLYYSATQNWCKSIDVKLVEEFSSFYILLYVQSGRALNPKTPNEVVEYKGLKSVTLKVIKVRDDLFILVSDIPFSL